MLVVLWMFKGKNDNVVSVHATDALSLPFD
jgi:hypothetical protein